MVPPAGAFGRISSTDSSGMRTGAGTVRSPSGRMGEGADRIYVCPPVLQTHPGSLSNVRKLTTTWSTTIKVQ